MVKNLPAKAGDTGSIPDLGRSHMQGSNEACVLQPLSLEAPTAEPTCDSCQSPCALEPVLRNRRSHHSETPVHRN